MRYLIDGAVGDRTRGVFPWGTFIVNATGSLLLGLLTGVALHHGFPETPRIVLGTGFCGAYTTFSTFTFETVRLAEQSASNVAARNALGTLCHLRRGRRRRTRLRGAVTDTGAVTG